jgi:CBS domain-containing protein
MIAADIMTRALVTISPDTPLPDVIRLLLDKRVGALPVVEGASVVGVVAESDLLRRIELGTEPRPTSWLGLFVSDNARAEAFVRGHGRLARDVMTQPAITVPADTPIGEVAELLEKRGISRVPVLRDGRLVGVVGRSDILRALASRLTPLPARGEDDRRVREAIVTTIEASGWLEGTADVTIIVEAGVVNLWGTVAGEAIHRALVVAVGEVPGVREVRDHLSPATSLDPLDRPNWPSPAPP